MEQYTFQLNLFRPKSLSLPTRVKSVPQLAKYINSHEPRRKHRKNSKPPLQRHIQAPDHRQRNDKDVHVQQDIGTPLRHRSRHQHLTVIDQLGRSPAISRGRGAVMRKERDQRQVDKEVGDEADVDGVSEASSVPENAQKKGEDGQS